MKVPLYAAEEAGALLQESASEDESGSGGPSESEPATHPQQPGAPICLVIGSYEYLITICVYSSSINNSSSSPAGDQSWSRSDPGQPLQRANPRPCPHNIAPHEHATSSRAERIF